MAKYICLGTTLTVNSVVIAQVRSIEPCKPTRGKVESTCLDAASETKTFLAGMIEVGPCNFTLAYDPSLAGHTGLETLAASGDIVTCLITWPDSTTQSFSAFVGKLGAGTMDPEGLLTAEVTLEATGTLTY
jgi:hypothetical protein